MSKCASAHACLKKARARISGRGQRSVRVGFCNPLGARFSLNHAGARKRAPVPIREFAYE
jgi:hypothetical protein